MNKRRPARAAGALATLLAVMAMDAAGAQEVVRLEASPRSLSVVVGSPAVVRISAFDSLGRSHRSGSPAHGSPYRSTTRW